MTCAPGDPRAGRRRLVIGIAAGVLAGVGTGVARAQSPTAAKVRRIGVIDIDPEAHAHLWNEFIAEFARLGHVEGRDVVFERRVVRVADPTIDRVAAELVAANVDVLFAARGTPSAMAAKRATATIPIVFGSSADPVGAGLVASLAHPGGNITGGSGNSGDVTSKSLELLIEILGRRQLRVVQIQSRSDMAGALFASLRRTIDASAQRLGVRYEYVSVDATTEIGPLLGRLAQERVDAVTFESITMDDAERARMADRSRELRLIMFGDAEAGDLFEYVSDWLELARIAARNVDKILKGTPPAQIPVQQPSNYLLAVNLKTAKALGVTIPNGVLLRANRIIE